MLLSQHPGDFPFFSQVGAQSHTVATTNKILSVEADPKLTDVKGSICYFLRKSNCNLTHRSALLPSRKEPPPAAKHGTAKPQAAMFSLQSTPSCTGPLTAGQFSLPLHLNDTDKLGKFN